MTTITGVHESRTSDFPIDFNNVLKMLIQKHFSHN